jgi:hypothetical protein
MMVGSMAHAKQFSSPVAVENCAPYGPSGPADPRQSAARSPAINPSRRRLQCHCRRSQLQTRHRRADLCLLLIAIARVKRKPVGGRRLLGNERMTYSDATRACQFHAVLMMDSRS